MPDNDAKPHRQPTTKTYGWGYNNYGGLGLGHSARVMSPTRVGLPAGTVDLQGGTDFTVALTLRGQVFTWGGNSWGQLGDGTTTSRFTPHQVVLRGNPHITSIAVGEDHVVALSRAGSVYAWGRNDLGQAGVGQLSDRALLPISVKVPGSGKVTAIATGNACSLAIYSDGAVYAWGHATPLGEAAPTSGLGATLGGVGAVLQAQRLSLPSGVTAHAVDAGHRHLVVVTQTGEVLTYGVNPYGRELTPRLKLHSSWGKVATISAGDHHTLALTSRGVVLAWGLNRYGQLGTGDTTHHDQPVKVVVPGLSGQVTQVIAGGDTSYLRTSKRVFAWGHSGWGQHGTGGTQDVLRPRPVPLPEHIELTALHTGRFHSFASITSVGR